MDSLINYLVSQQRSALVKLLKAEKRSDTLQRHANAQPMTFPVSLENRVKKEFEEKVPDREALMASQCAALLKQEVQNVAALVTQLQCAS